MAQVAQQAPYNGSTTSIFATQEGDNPFLPVTPVTNEGPAWVSGAKGSNRSCDAYDTRCNWNSSSSAHLIEVRRFIFTNSSLDASNDVKRYAFFRPLLIVIFRFSILGRSSFSRLPRALLGTGRG